MRNVSDKLVETIKTHTLCSIMFFFFENRALYEKMWKNIVEPDRPQMTIWRMSFVRRITKSTNTHSEYLVLDAFPRQQWLREHASMLRYKCIARLVLFTEDFNAW